MKIMAFGSKNNNAKNLYYKDDFNSIFDFYLKMIEDYYEEVYFMVMDSDEIVSRIIVIDNGKMIGFRKVLDESLMILKSDCERKYDNLCIVVTGYDEMHDNLISEKFYDFEKAIKHYMILKSEMFDRVVIKIMDEKYNFVFNIECDKQTGNETFGFKKLDNELDF